MCIWDLEEAGFNVAPTYKFNNVHVNGCEDVDWHRHNCNLFGSVGNDSMFALHDLRRHENSPSQRIRAHDGDVHCLSFNSGNEHLVATGGADGLVNLWDTRKMKERLHSCKGHKKEVLQLSWAPHNETILGSCSADRRVNIWDINKIGNEQTPEEAEDGPPELYFVHGGHKASVSDFSWNMNEGYEGIIASVAEGNALQIWEEVSVLM